jgi:hypothetical protein
MANAGRTLDRAFRLALPAVLASSALAAQATQHTSVARQLYDQTSLRAVINFAAGEVTLRPAPADMLYRMSAEYDSERYQPLTRYDSESQSVVLGLEPTGQGGLRVSSKEHLEQTADIELSRMVPLSLDITLGAAVGTLDLGGLRIRRVRLETAGSRTRVRFAQVNPGRCDTLAVKSGAAEVSLESLGNSRCDTIQIDGGAGGVTLDLGGAWAADGRVGVAVAVGQVKLKIPRDLGVELSLEQFLSSYEPKGFVREGKVWRTPGYAQAGHRVALHLSTTVGGVNVAWVP